MLSLPWDARTAYHGHLYLALCAPLQRECACCTGTVRVWARQRCDVLTAIPSMLLHVTGRYFLTASMLKDRQTGSWKIPVPVNCDEAQERRGQERMEDGRVGLER